MQRELIAQDAELAASRMVAFSGLQDAEGLTNDRQDTPGPHLCQALAVMRT